MKFLTVAALLALVIQSMSLSLKENLKSHQEERENGNDESHEYLGNLQSIANQVLPGLINANKR